jgi:hypothetical protein
MQVGSNKTQNTIKYSKVLLLTLCLFFQLSTQVDKKKVKNNIQDYCFVTRINFEKGNR